MDATISAPRPAITDQDAVDDWRGLGDLVAMATERLTAPVEGMHEAIGDGWRGLVGNDRSPDPTRRRLVTRKLYGTVRLVGSLAGATLGMGATTIGRHRQVPPLWGSPVGAGIQAAVNALWGDEFERRTSPMHTELGIRDTHGDRVAGDAATLARVFPTPSRRLAVLLHGLGKTERCWSSEADDSGDVFGLPNALEADGFTTVLARYNTGRHVSDNARALSLLLEEIVANWPVGIDEIVLIGHSMGGLVARGSLHAGAAANHRWMTTVRHLVALGTPHFGSPIEKGAHVASRILETAAISRPLGQFIDERSAGIKDMRHGAIGDTVRRDQATDPTQRGIVVVPPLAGVRQHHIASVVTKETSHPFGALVGDLVVRVTSATGGASNSRGHAANVRVFGGLNHLGMLHDPAVHSQIREWLTPLPGGPETATS